MSDFIDDKRRKMQAVILQGLPHRDGERMPHPNLRVRGGSSEWQKARRVVLHPLEREGRTRRGRWRREPAEGSRSHRGTWRLTPSLPGTCGGLMKGRPIEPQPPGKWEEFTSVNTLPFTNNYRLTAEDAFPDEAGLACVVALFWGVRAGPGTSGRDHTKSV